jgi:lipopolysaccharide transport protein LptA
MKKPALKIIIAVLAVFASCCLLHAAKEQKTIITGGEMEITNGGKVVVFTGGAKVEKGPNELTADRLVQDKKKNKVEATGNVVFKTINQQNEKLRGRSGRAVFEMDEEKGELSGGRAEMAYYAKTSTGPIILRAANIAFDTRKEELYAKGEVEIITSSVTAFSPYATFIQRTKNIVLTGPKPQPYVIYYEKGKPNRYKADKITFLNGGDRINLEGNVNAVVMVDDRDEKAKNK